MKSTKQKKTKISFLVPVYNEERTITKILNLIEKVNLGIKKEIVVVDDGSTDNTKSVILEYIKKKKNIVLISKPNGGKGSAIREGIKKITGNFLIIQDADLEYNPDEIKKLLQEIEKGKFDVIYGSRILNRKNSYIYFTYYLGNIFLSRLTSFLYHTKLTDIETCYKLIPSYIIKRMRLKSDKFDIEPEITAKILRNGYSIGEVPIIYQPRSKEEGKKIKWGDGLKAIFVLFRERIK